MSKYQLDKKYIPVAVRPGVGAGGSLVARVNCEFQGDGSSKHSCFGCMGFLKFDDDHHPRCGYLNNKKLYTDQTKRNGG